MLPPLVIGCAIHDCHMGTGLNRVSCTCNFLLAAMPGEGDMTEASGSDVMALLLEGMQEELKWCIRGRRT